MVLSDEPTRIQPTAPSPPGGGPALKPHEPATPRYGGPGGPPPPPPRRTGGGGGGGGDDWGDGPEPGDERSRNPLLLVLAGLLVLVALFLVLTLTQGGDSSDDRVVTSPAVTTPAEATTPAETPPAEEEEPEEQPETTPVTTPPASQSNGGATLNGGAGDNPDVDPDADLPVLDGDSVTKFKVTQGETVAFKVTSDTAQEVHVHGYDKLYDLAAGETKTIEFTANLTGIFEIEFEGEAKQIGELTVEP